jgi:hypothetical protein
MKFIQKCDNQLTLTHNTFTQRTYNSEAASSESFISLRHHGDDEQILKIFACQ